MGQYFYDFRDFTSGRYPPAGLLRPTIDQETSADIAQHFGKDAAGLLDTVWLLSGSSNFNVGIGYMPDDLPQALDVQCLVKVRGLSYAGGNFSNDGPGFHARMSSPAASSDRLEMGYGGALNSVNSFGRRRVADASTTIWSDSSGRARNTVPIWIRYEYTGSTMRHKNWNDGDAEPVGWNASYTDSNILVPGYFAFMFMGIPRAYQLFQLSFGTNGDEAPLLPPKGGRIVAGIVRSPAGTPVARRVILYSSRTGERIAETTSDPVTGAFSFPMTNNFPVSVVAIDDTGNLWNLAGKDRIVPALP